ncbi:MAG: hypothetical protein MMC33_002637 [Icmadophila ericetorum]|nr:hypothetical protein [Icmadophila ericetorum]
MAPLLEVCCFNLPSAILASRAGADRIEFCTNFAKNGTTPSLEDVRVLQGQISCPLHVMIRPDASYHRFDVSAAELEDMKEAISRFKKLPHVSGFVFGCLTPEGKIDEKKTSELVTAAAPLPCTFHRAFDAAHLNDRIEALEQIISTGCSTLLTSGGSDSAILGAEMIAQLVEATKNRIIIMPGGGVRSSNAERLMQKTGAQVYHSSCLLGDNREMPSWKEIRRLRRIVHGELDDSKPDEIE